MKKFFKIGCLGFIVLIVLGGIIGALAGGGEEATTEAEPASEAAAEPAAAPAEEKKEEAPAEEKKEEPAPAADGILTTEKYDQIKNGMTYEEVVGIIGSEGQVMSETGEKGTDFHTVMYEWETDGFLSSANFMFQGGKLESKAQMGVADSDSPEVSLEKFNQVENGMTTEEVFAIVGGEGEIQSETGEIGTDFYTVMYSYPGEGGLGSNVSFMFQGDKLQNKSQFGLE